VAEAVVDALAVAEDQVVVRVEAVAAETTIKVMLVNHASRAGRNRNRTAIP
jgi:hypothetical protein